MNYFAHRTEDGRTQSINDHLLGTALLSKSFAPDLCKELAYHIGLMHDIGKYSEAFQKRIQGDTSTKVEHAICGAKEIQSLFPNEIFSLMSEYCIAGHHTGLPDGGSSVDLPETPSLMGRMKRTTQDYFLYKQELTPVMPPCIEMEQLLKNLDPKKDLKEIIELYAFWTRILFSCLADADYIDTESFFHKTLERGIIGDFETALKLLNTVINNFPQTTQVQKARTVLQSQAVSCLSNLKEINILDMPTGSGKTLCSMKIALEQAIKTGKKRIIYVIPFTSIIEQTANTFEAIFGETLPILQHHSNYFFENETSENDLTSEKLKRTCENWDAPLIITTSVQFFQSLYHYKGSHLRKLHNMADAVIIFDEIHLIPIEYLQPCFRAMGYITKFLNSNAIFLSATMPDYKSLFSNYLPKNTVCQLISDKSAFPMFQNCTYKNLGKTTFEAVIQKAGGSVSSLIIVNSRKSAQQVYDLLPGKKFHLSTYMTPEHRSRVIKEIKDCLEEHKRILENPQKTAKDCEKLIVVSTSLVEAGVDFDFETVFRQLAGLDSILQAGGRCNREGRRPHGFVYIFETDEYPKGDLAIRAHITADLLTKYPDISCKDSITDYFDRIFGYKENDIKENSISEFATKISINAIPFRSYAESFEYIKSDTIGIIINASESVNKLLRAMEFGGKNILKNLQRDTVSVYFYEFEEMKKLGILREVKGIFVLENNDYYSKEKGLRWKDSLDENYLI